MPKSVKAGSTSQSKYANRVYFMNIFVALGAITLHRVVAHAHVTSIFGKLLNGGLL